MSDPESMDVVITDVHSISRDDMQAMWENVPDGEPSDIPRPDDEVAGSEGESSSNDSNIKLDTGDCVAGCLENSDCDTDVGIKIIEVFSLPRIEFENEENFTKRGDGDDERVSKEISVSDGSVSTLLLPPCHILQQMPYDCKEIQVEVESLPCSNLEGAVESGDSSVHKVCYDQGTEDHDERYGEEASRCEDDVEGSDPDVDDFRAQLYDFENASNYVLKRSVGVLVTDDFIGPGLLSTCDNNMKKSCSEEGSGKVVIIEDYDDSIDISYELVPNPAYLQELEYQKSLEETIEKSEKIAKEVQEWKVEMAMVDMLVQEMVAVLDFDENKDKHLENGDRDVNERRGL